MISRGGGLALVCALEHLLDELAGRHRDLLVDDPAAHAAHAAAADHELLHRGRELVLLDAEHVGVDVIGEHDRALLEHVLERLDAVAQPGGLLVLEAALASFISRWSRVITVRSWLAMNVDELVDDLAVLLDRDPLEHGPPQRPIWPAKHGRPLAIALRVARSREQVRIGNAFSIRSMVSRTAQIFGIRAEVPRPGMRWLRVTITRGASSASVIAMYG